MSAKFTDAAAAVRAAIAALDDAIEGRRSDGADAATPGELARLELRRRAHRAASLPRQLLGEPCWDIALVLFIASESGERLCPYSAFKEASVAPPAGFRAVEALVARDLVERQEPAASGQPFVILTPQGLDAIRHALLAN